MPKMYKALRIIENFATRRGIMIRSFPSTGMLLLPRGFKPDHCMKLEKDGRNIVIVATTSEKFYIKRQSATEFSEVCYVALANELKQGGIKQI